MKSPASAAALAFALLLSGCMVGPKYSKPAAPIPQEFRNASAPSAASIADLPWWDVFQDPVLQKLIRTGLERSFDVRIAAEQIVAARAQVGVVRSRQLPSLSANPFYSGGKDPTLGQLRNANLIGATADASYQLDLFGALRSATAGARASLLATEEARNIVLMTLVSDIATDYYQLLSLDLQIQISRETVASQQRSVKLTQSRVDAGVATKVDMLQAKQLLDAAEARIPDLERQIARIEDGISILLGNYPEGVPRGAALAAQSLPPQVPEGLTSALLERRPDIRRAERNLMYYNAQIGVAKAAFFPQISLTGSLGRSATLTALMNSSGGIWTYAAALAQPVFQGGRLKSQLRVAESQQRQSLLIYMQTVQSAFGDTSDAIVDYHKFREIRAKQATYVEDLEESVRLAKMRYNGGVTTYLEVLDAQRALYAQQISLAQIRGSEFQSVVQLYRALGGGWQQ